MEDMDNRSEVRDFLISRRGKVTPDPVGLAAQGRCRVPGLRRSEVADLAGVSVEYDTQLERGNLRGASVSVLEALARTAGSARVRGFLHAVLPQPARRLPH